MDRPGDYVPDGRVGSGVAARAPHRSGRAGFPHPAPHVMRSLRDAGPFRSLAPQVAGQDLVVPPPGTVTPLGSAAEPLLPDSTDLEAEPLQARSIPRDPVVRVVTR